MPGSSPSPPQARNKSSSLENTRMRWLLFALTYNFLPSAEANRTFELSRLRALLAERPDTHTECIKHGELMIATIDDMDPALFANADIAWQRKRGTQCHSGAVRRCRNVLCQRYIGGDQTHTAENTQRHSKHVFTWSPFTSHDRPDKCHSLGACVLNPVA